METNAIPPCWKLTHQHKTLLHCVTVLSGGCDSGSSRIVVEAMLAQVILHVNFVAILAQAKAQGDVR